MIEINGFMFQDEVGEMMQKFYAKYPVGSLPTGFDWYPATFTALVWDECTAGYVWHDSNVADGAD